MKNISFRQFMINYNFRYYNENGEGDREKEDSTVIRIHYYIDKDEIFSNIQWFEFGMYDYRPDSYKLNHLEKIFSDVILDSYVSSFFHNERLNIIEVYLTNEEYNDEF